MSKLGTGLALATGLVALTYAGYETKNTMDAWQAHTEAHLAAQEAGGENPYLNLADRKEFEHVFRDGFYATLVWGSIASIVNLAYGIRQENNRFGTIK